MAEPAVATSSDIYSLGVVLYELLCGAPAQKVEHTTGLGALRRGILDVDPPPPARWRRRRGGAWCAAVTSTTSCSRRCARSRRAGMPPSSSSRRTCAATSRGYPSRRGRGAGPTISGKFLRRNKWLVAGAAFVAVTLVSATVISLRQARRADAAAREAEERFADVRALASSLLFEVDETVRELQGATAARELIVKRALQYLDRLSRKGSDDPALARELAAAYMKIGDIQGNPLAPNLGRVADGLVSYGRAQALLDAIPADDLPTRWGRARALLGSGILRIDHNELAAARASLLQGFELVASLPRDAGFDFRAVAQAYSAMEFLARFTSNLDDLRRASDGLLALAEEWVRIAPSEDARYWVGIAHGVRASASHFSAEVDEALDALRRSLQVYRELVDAHPENAPYRRERAYALCRLGGWLGGVDDGGMWVPNQGDAPGAEAALRECIEDYERLAARDANDTRIQRSLMTHLTTLGLSMASHDPAGAVVLLERARAGWATLPGPTSLRGDWRTRCALAAPLAAVGRRDEALAEAKVGMGRLDELMRGEKTHALQVSHAMCRALVAEMWRTLGEPVTAAAELDHVVVELREIIAASPLGILPYVGLAAVLETLAALRPEQGCPLREQALAAFRAWPGAATGYTQRRLAELDQARCR